MASQPLKCPMTKQQILDEHFIENRTRLLDIAAFLDRLDRTGRDGGEADFRAEVFSEAIALLWRPSPSRVKTIQMIFSDPTTAPLALLDQKSARGAYDRDRREAP